MQPTSFRLSEMTSRQLERLVMTTGHTRGEIVAIALDRMYQQERKVKTVLIKIKYHSDLHGGARYTEPGVMSNFPLFEEQWWEGVDDGSIELHLGNRTELSATQMQYMDTHPDVIEYDYT